MQKNIEQEVENIKVDYVKISEIVKINNHFHNSHQIIFVIEGTAEIIINSKAYKLTKGSIAFISNLEHHELKVTKAPYERYNVLIEPKFLQLFLNTPVLASIFMHRHSNFIHVISLLDEELEDVMVLFKKISLEYIRKDSFWDTNSGAQITQLFVLLYRNNKNRFPLITPNPLLSTIFEIQKYIESHFTENLSLSDLSEKYYIDMYYLSRNFKAFTGFCFRDYLILQRLSKAKELLLHSGDSITTISLSSGFQNVNHFIRIFKKYEGITPHQYRK